MNDRRPWRALLEGPASGTLLFRVAAGLALALHAGLIFGRDGLWGGGDLPPHLRLMQLTREDPGLYSTYAPAYHLWGALLEPLLGALWATGLFALLGAALLIAGFRAFQKAAGLPDAASAVFALTPYLLSLSWCTPKVEAWGYGLLLLGLAGLLRGRVLWVAALLAACFAVHTASALLFGLAGGALCLARRDLRGLGSLALGAGLATPLIGAHLAAGCSFSEALLFAPGGYARDLHESLVPDRWPWLVPLAGPVALGAAALGAGPLWRERRSLGVLCGLLLALYANNFWLAPFGARTLLTPLRGLSLLAIPVAVAAGVWAGRGAATRAWVVGLCAVWALFSSVQVVPRACFVRPIAADEAREIEVERCHFTWRRPRRP